MKQTMLFLACATILLASCSKEQVVDSAQNSKTVNVTVSAQILNTEQSKASWDNDGNGLNVDHWIMEVYDAQGILFDRKEKTNQSGLTNTFEVVLIKNQSYKFAFWADKAGSYTTTDLRKVKTISNVAGKDSRDAFFAEKDYTSIQSETITAQLYRPFSQVNIITTDLDKIYQQMAVAQTTADYEKFCPKDLKLKLKTYNEFNVLTGDVTDVQTSELTIGSCYADFMSHAAKTTIFMDYLFASAEKEVKNIDLTFKSNDVAINYSFTNIPLQRNYRTNISGNLLSNDATVNIEIIPIWQDPEFEEELWSPGMITPVTAVEGVYTIERPSQLAWIEQQVNSGVETFAGKTVKLAKDIDLNNGAWTCIGQTGAGQFSGTLDGQGFTIKNLNIKNEDGSQYCSTGLFGWLNGATVKNVKIDKASVLGHHYVGVIAGYMEGAGCTIENCTVSNATISCTHVNDEADGDKCGGIVGFAGNASTPVKMCQVSNTEIDAGRDAGQIVGAAIEENIVQCSANEVTVDANGTSTSENIRQELIGRVL